MTRWPSLTLPPRPVLDWRGQIPTQDPLKKLIFKLFVTAAMASPAFAALKPGDMAPDFSASGSLGGKDASFHLKDALKKGPVVVYFYPSAYTGGCDLEAHTFPEQ